MYRDAKTTLLLMVYRIKVITLYSPSPVILFTAYYKVFDHCFFLLFESQSSNSHFFFALSLPQRWWVAPTKPRFAKKCPPTSFVNVAWFTKHHGSDRSSHVKKTFQVDYFSPNNWRTREKKTSVGKQTTLLAFLFSYISFHTLRSLFGISQRISSKLPPNVYSETHPHVSSWIASVITKDISSRVLPNILDEYLLGFLRDFFYWFLSDFHLR